jgi:hypothetical protein
MGTEKFLAMTETSDGRDALLALNIPCYAVGSTDLRGSGSVTGGTIDLGGAADATKGILNATFFAPSTGATPQVWASGSVNGAYTGTPTGGTVGLQGYAPATGSSNSITADFNIVRFDTTGTTNWGATVTNGNAPANSLTGATGYTASNAVSFQGGAAGAVNVTTQTFTGTAAGIAAEGAD